MSLHDNTETHANHHCIVLCIEMNDLLRFSEQISHTKIYHHLHEPIFHNRGNKIMFSLQLSSHIRHYLLTLHGSSLCLILLFPRGCLLFGFHLVCVYVTFLFCFTIYSCLWYAIIFCARVQPHISIWIG